MSLSIGGLVDVAAELSGRPGAALQMVRDTFDYSFTVLGTARRHQKRGLEGHCSKYLAPAAEGTHKNAT